MGKKKKEKKRRKDHSQAWICVFLPMNVSLVFFCSTGRNRATINGGFVGSKSCKK